MTVRIAESVRYGMVIYVVPAVMTMTLRDGGEKPFHAPQRGECECGADYRPIIKYGLLVCAECGGHGF